MNTTKIKKDLEHLKIHIDSLENWISYANDIIYQIENKLMDIEDMQTFSKMENVHELEYFAQTFCEDNLQLIAWRLCHPQEYARANPLPMICPACGLLS